MIFIYERIFVTLEKRNKNLDDELNKINLGNIEIRVSLLVSESLIFIQIVCLSGMSNVFIYAYKCVFCVICVIFVVYTVYIK